MTLTADHAIAPAADALAPGSQLGRYVIDHPLGAGGMGTVYAARDTLLGREVALKLMRPRSELDVMQRRLRREAMAMARLSHPNVVPVFDTGEHGGHLFIAMELVVGETLRAWIAATRPWREVVRLFVRAGRGLEAAHAAGVSHRDFKPDNVIIGADDEPRITDFGLARELDDAAPVPSVIASTALPQLTARSQMAGTPAYIAPEQLLGKRAGAAADQFSFCVSLFEALYGARPFAPATSADDALLADIRAGRILRPDRARRLPRWLRAAVDRGLRYEPDQRWPSMAALLDALDRGLRRRRERTTALVALGVAALAAALYLRAAPSAERRTCAEATGAGNDAVAIVVCREEYARTADPSTGVRYANALRRTGNLREAATVAKELLATPARADALYTLGKVASDEGRSDEAARSLQQARELHQAAAQWGDEAVDLVALAAIARDPIDKLTAYADAVREADRAGDRRTAAYAHQGAGVVLSTIGLRGAALAELDRAAQAMTRPDDRLRLELERGNVYQYLDENALAVAAFERASAEQAVGTTHRALSIRLNLAHSLAEIGRIAEARQQLGIADTLDPDDRLIGERLSLAGRVAWRAGELDRAAELTERAVARDPDEVDDLIERCTQRAEIALSQRDPEAAERWARRAIGQLEARRPPQPPSELRAWLSIRQRISYEVLFASQAARGDAAGALVTFDRYHGLDALAGLVRGDRRGPDDADSNKPWDTGPLIAALAARIPPLAASALATPADDRAILDAARSASLLVVVVARGAVWRITADHGPPQVTSIGALTELRAPLDRLRNEPGDRVAGAALGARLVPPEIARPTAQALNVVLDAPLADLPVAGLWIDGRPLISARPIVQPARVADIACAALPPAPGRSIAIEVRDGDPHGTPARAALLDASTGDRLDVTASRTRDALGEALVLGDGPLYALDIAGRGRTASQVVLAARDLGTAGGRALAHAFLAAGADQVIAPIRPVPAAASARLIEALRDARTVDLARALARLQTHPRAAPAARDEDWLAFAAFGRASCVPPTR